MSSRTKAAEYGFRLAKIKSGQARFPAGKIKKRRLKKMKNTKKTLMMAARIILALAAITCIIISMVTDKVTPYLGIGLFLTAIANVINCFSIKKMKEEEQKNP